MTSLWHWIPAYNYQVSADVMLQCRADAVSLAKAGIDVHASVGHSCDLLAMRNDAVDRAVASGVDYLFMQDADTSSPMVGGPVLPMLETMRETGAAAVFAIVTMRNMGEERANVWPCKPGEVFDVTKAGTGMVLIDINQIKPWYEAYDGPLFHVLYESKRSARKRMSMDVFFTKFLRGEYEGVKPALRVVCDGRIPTRHANAMSVLDYDPSDWADAPDLDDNKDAA